MHKKSLLLFTCTALLLSGCSGNSISDTLDKVSDSISEVQETPAATATAAPTSTPGPKETSLALGKNGTVGDWKIKAKKASVKTNINNGNRQYKPGKGNSFVVVSLSVQNNGEKDEQFIPRLGLENKMIVATLIYNDKDEYSPIQLLSYDKDLVTSTIKAGKTKNGIITFEVPKKAAKKLKKIKLKIGTKMDYLVYNLK